MLGAGKKILIAVGIVVYVVLIAALTIHFRFPYRTAAQVAVQQIETGRPIKVSFEGPKPGLPFNVNLTDVSLGLAGPTGSTPLMDFSRIKIKVKPLSLLTRQVHLTFTAWTSGGKIKGRLDYQLSEDRELKLAVTDMDLPDFSFTDPGGKGALSGRLQAKVTVLGADGIIPVDGSGTINMGPGRLSQLNVPDLPLTELDFDTMTLNFKMDRTGVLIEKMDMDGPQGGFSLNGRIRDFKRLALNLAGSARMGPADNPMFSAQFRMTGTPQRPNVQITSSKGPGG